MTATVWLAAVLAVSAAHGALAACPAGDVSLQPDGSLRGRVVWAAGATGHGSASMLGVRLVRDGRVVAETSTGPRGVFTLRHLAGGFYQIVVNAPGGAGQQFYRVWPAATAPPGGAQEVTIALGDGLVRGQSPFPPTSFRKAAVLSAIVAGAIAAPIIYNSTKAEPHIPASP